MRKTKPIQGSIHPLTRALLGIASVDALSDPRSAVRNSLDSCNRLQPDATPRKVVQPDATSGKTNPIPTARLRVPHAGAERSTAPDRPGRPSAIHLSPQQRAAARLLALGKTIPAVARELNLSRSTVWRWQQNPAFTAELDRLQDYLAAVAIRARSAAQAR